VSAARVEEKYHVTFKQNQSITVHIAPDFRIEFRKDPKSKFYSADFTDGLLARLRAAEKHNTNFEPGFFVTTVEDRVGDFTKRDVLRAELARAMTRKLGYPSDQALSYTLSKGALINADTTGRDIVNAAAIFGPSVASLKGKTKDLGPVRENIFPVPRSKVKHQTMSCDVFHWRAIIFILAVVIPLQLIMTRWIPVSAKESEMKEHLESFLKIIRSQGFDVEKIVVDSAGALGNLEGKLTTPVRVVGPRTHVPEAEAYIGVVKQRLRCLEAALPYGLPKRLIPQAVYFVSACLNIVLKPGQTISSREAFLGIKCNAKLDLRAEFGEYCQVHVSPDSNAKNTNALRTVGALAVGPFHNNRGTYHFYGLRSGKIFKGDRWSNLPMPDVVIDAVNHVYALDERAKYIVPAFLRKVIEEDVLKQSSKVKRKKSPKITDSVVLDEEKSPPQSSSLHQEVVSQEFDSTTPDPLTPLSVTADGVVAQSSPEELQTGQEVEQECVLQIPPASTSQNSSPDTDHVQSTDVLQTEIDCFSPDNMAKSFVESCSSRGQDWINVEAIVQELDERCVASTIPEEVESFKSYRLTVSAALEKSYAGASEAIRKEFAQLVEKEVWEPVTHESLRGSDRSKIIRSSIFMKEKFFADGMFEKWKARFVAGGNNQSVEHLKSIYKSLTSPTVALESVMLALGVAAAENHDIATVDVTGAFLECSLKDDDLVIVEVSAKVAKLLIETSPNYKRFLSKDGKIFLKLKKALYGCVQASMLWYERLRAVLEGAGLKAHPYDKCYYTGSLNGSVIHVLFHIDDLLMTSKDTKALDDLVSIMKSEFAAITVTRGKKHSYLAMNIVADTETVSLDMCGYLDKTIEGKKLRAGVRSPCTAAVFEIDNSAKELTVEERAMFHTDVYRLLYMSKRTRMDIMVGVSFLSGRVAKPTDEDQAKLVRILSFLAATRDQKVFLKRGVELDFHCYTDASFACHCDGTSRTGILMFIAGAAVLGWTTKQSLVTLSSTEAEIVGLSDGTKYVLWSREWFKHAGQDMTQPTVIFQDNQACLTLMAGDGVPRHRTRHLHVRYFFARDRVVKGDIVLEYKCTLDMIADLLTKGVTGKLFDDLCYRMFGMCNVCYSE
jgi:hypothetical protein